jgi:hypothetical protein
MCEQEVLLSDDSMKLCSHVSRLFGTNDAKTGSAGNRDGCWVGGTEVAE